MTQTIIPRNQVAEQLAVPVRVLIRYESRGLVRHRQVRSESGGGEGYGPAEIRRVWTIVSCQAQPGNQPGGRRGGPAAPRPHPARSTGRSRRLAGELRAALEFEPAPDDDA